MAVRGLAVSMELQSGASLGPVKLLPDCQLLRWGVELLTCTSVALFWRGYRFRAEVLPASYLG